MGAIRARVAIVLALVLALEVVLDHPGRPAIATGPDGVTYVHDAAGRLIAAIDPLTDAALYSYDEVGNLTSITRRPASQVSVLQFTPSKGPPGTDVTIYGSGYSTDPAQDAVSFNGTNTLVLTATPTKIVARVPTGATTGPITVTSPGGSATSQAQFTVGTASAPTVSGVDRTVLAPDDSLTISGSNFDPAGPEFNNVLVGGNRAEVTAVSPTSLTVKVGSTGSGRVSVATAGGLATLPTDIYVVPDGYSTGQLAATARADPGVQKTVSISTANKIGIVLFDATQGQRLSLNFNAGSCGFCVVSEFLLGPSGSILYAASPRDGQGIFMEPRVLPATGTYSWLVIPGTNTGNFAFTYWIVPPDAAGTIAFDGVPVTIGNTVPGQNFQLTFDGTQDTKVSLLFGTPTCGFCEVDLTIYKPDRSVWLNLRYGGGAPAYREALLLPATGSYRAYFHPRGGPLGQRE
jgi:YD repeat-containing protein